MQEDQDKIFNLIFEQDEITWQSIIYELIKSGEVNPWDVDISLLSKRFLDMLHKLKEMNLRVSGKVVLASSILLRMKSDRFLSEDIPALDSIIAGELEEAYYGYGEDYEPLLLPEPKPPVLYPRTPQPRKRKVSIYDLIDALDKALEVKERRKRYEFREAPEVKVPTKSRDITLVIRDVFEAIRQLIAPGKERVTFSQLVPSGTKEDKIYTFIPLLHLDHLRKVNLSQQQHFGEIEVELLERELGKGIGKLKV